MIRAGDLLRIMLFVVGVLVTGSELREGRWRWSLRYLLALFALVGPPMWLFMQYGPSPDMETLASLPGLLILTWQMVLVVFAMLLGTAGRSAGASFPSSREDIGLRLFANAAVVTALVVTAHLLSRRRDASVAYPVATWLCVLASASLARRLVGPPPEMRA